MGLDTLAFLWNPEQLKPGDPAPEEAFEDLRDCPGLNVDFPPSFRGKVYADWVYRVTHVTLYQPIIPPYIVARMADGLAADVANDDGLWRVWIDAPPPPPPDTAPPEERAAWAAWWGLDPDAYDPDAWRRERARAVAAFFRRCAEKRYCLVGSW